MIIISYNNFITAPNISLIKILIKCKFGDFIVYNMRQDHNNLSKRKNKIFYKHSLFHF